MKRKLLKLLSVAAVAFFVGQANAQIVFKVVAPAGLQGSYPFSASNDGTGGGWGADLSNPANAVTGLAVLAHDASSCDTMGNVDPSVSLSNAAQIAGNIAVFYRGCSVEFGAKALQAENAGAIACVIINSAPQATDPNATVLMGAATYGGSVSIPVVMISVNTGALLRPALDAGTLQLFIGNKIGLNAYDVKVGEGDVVRARSTAFPNALIPTEQKDTIWVGALVMNFGSSDQTDVVLNARITLNGVEMYNDTSAATAIVSTDTAAISLPFYNPLLPGDYMLTYKTWSLSNADADTADNTVITSFKIQDSLYAKSRFDSTGGPIANAFYRPSNTTSSFFKQCIVLDEGANNDQITVHGLSFALSSTNGLDLTGLAFETTLEEWTDASQTSFTSINPVVSQFYTYPADLQNKFVDVEYSSPFTLVDNTRYLACVTVDNLETYLGYDTGLNYTTTINTNQEYYFPLYDNDAASNPWNPNAFGSDIVPAIIVHTKANVVLGLKENAVSDKILIYPNPATDYATINFSVEKPQTVNVTVSNIVGQVVSTYSKQIKSAGTESIHLDVQSLKPGIYFITSILGNQRFTNKLIIN